MTKLSKLKEENEKIRQQLIQIKEDSNLFREFPFSSEEIKKLKKMLKGVEK